jgi:DNA-directed RNA polymerase subunit RPC12/RpoP
MANDNTIRIIKHLEDKWGENVCPMCGHRDWNVPEEIYELREFQSGGLTIGGGPIVPVLPITCAYCGNTVLVNGIVAGLFGKGESGDE